MSLTATLLDRGWSWFGRPILFRSDAETAHEFGMKRFAELAASPAGRLLFGSLTASREAAPTVETLGLSFPSPIGLAAGFDKNAKYLGPLASLGFGFVEIGTVTPRPQEGNAKPRLFRLPADRAIVNRMGFNNDGADAVAERLKSRPEGIVVGANLGRNKTTPNENAADDYCSVLGTLYELADYFVVNVSSPNTEGLRDLQARDELRKLLSAVLGKRNEVAGDEPPKPLLVKLAPDLSDDQRVDAVDLAIELGLDGLVATNTTISRDGLRSSAGDVEATGAGGLSGAPLTQRSRDFVRAAAEQVAGRMPIIGVGGIMSPHDAAAMLAAGATLVQTYTGFVYGGPGFAAQINEALSAGLPEPVPVTT